MRGNTHLQSIAMSPTFCPRQSTLSLRLEALDGGISLRGALIISLVLVLLLITNGGAG